MFRSGAARFLVLLIALVSCAASANLTPRPIRPGPWVELSRQGDSLRAIIAWDYPANDGHGALDSVRIGWTYGTQPLQYRSKRPPAARDTAYFRVPAVCEWMTGTVALVSWRRNQSSAAVTRDFEYGVDCPPPSPPSNVRWVDSVRRVP